MHHFWCKKKQHLVQEEVTSSIGIPGKTRPAPRVAFYGASARFLKRTQCAE